MRIASIRHALPSLQISNDAVIERIRRENAGRLTPQELNHVEQWLRGYFSAAGTSTRYYLDKGEKPFEVLTKAAVATLDQAGWSAGDVDFIIYTGVSRGWIEPSTAAAVQHLLGLSSATGFDVLDACAGWLRALEIAQAYLRSGTYRRGLIVNCECGLGEQADWQLESVDELEHRIAAYTIGEAATATAIEATEDTEDFAITLKTFGEHFDLCMIPLQAVDHFRTGSADHRHVNQQLFSLSRELVDIVTTKIEEVYAADPRFHQKFDIVFGHEVSETVCRNITTKLGFEDVYYSTHARFGNTVAASVPLAMSTALDEGRLKRGQRVLVILGASGVTVGLAGFRF